MQVHFLNWSDKHDQTLPCTSSRIRLPPSHTNDVHDFVEAPSMVPASCRTLAEVTAFKRVCDKEEESGVRKSGRRRAVEADDDADRAEAPGGEEAVPVPSINSGGMYVAASKKRAMNAMTPTWGISTWMCGRRDSRSWAGSRTWCRSASSRTVSMRILPSR